MAKLTRLASTVTARYYPASDLTDAFYLDGRLSGKREARAADITVDKEDRGFFFSVFSHSTVPGRDPAAEQAQPTVQELFERYRLSVGNALSKDEAFLNACRNSDRQNAYLEGAAAIRRIVTESGDLQLTRLYFDMPAFHNRLHQELLDELYPTLATTVTPSPYKVTQEDILAKSFP